MATAMIGFNFIKSLFVAGELYNRLPIVCRIARCPGRWPVTVYSRYTAFQTLKQLVRCDRQFSNALSGGMEDRVGNRRRDTHHRDFADAHDAERIHMRVVLFDEDHVHDWRGIGMDLHRIFPKIGVRNPAVAGIHDQMFHQRHADAADHAPDALAAGRLRIDDAAGAVGADHPAHARLAKIWVDCDLREYSPESVHREAASLVTRLHIG